MLMPKLTYLVFQYFVTVWLAIPDLIVKSLHRLKLNQKSHETLSPNVFWTQICNSEYGRLRIVEHAGYASQKLTCCPLTCPLNKRHDSRPSTRWKRERRLQVSYLSGYVVESGKADGGIWRAGRTTYSSVSRIVARHNLASGRRRDIFSGRPFELSTYTLSRGYRTVRYLLRVDQMQMCDVTMWDVERGTGHTYSARWFMIQ